MRFTRTLAAFALAAFAASTWARTAFAQLHPVEQGNKSPVISYEISFPNIVHHEAEVTAVFTSVPPGTLHTRMARSSTGRYALHEFAKNVYALKAVDSKGRQLVVTRPDPYGWDVAGHDGTVTVTYTLFADRADGTYPGFDAVQAHIQPQGTFLYARGFELRPVSVTIHRPNPAWTIATQLVPTSNPETFTAPGMQYLFDSPTHVGAIQWREWTETSGGRTLKFRAAVEIAAAAKYFAGIRPRRQYTVVEATVVPRSYQAGGLYARRPGDETEPLGDRMMEISDNIEHHEMRDPTRRSRSTCGRERSRRGANSQSPRGPTARRAARYAMARSCAVEPAARSARRSRESRRSICCDSWSVSGRKHATAP